MFCPSFRRRAAALALSALIAASWFTPAFAAEAKDGEKREAFLAELSALPHYREDRAGRYLAYLGSKQYTPEQVLRIVNTDADLPPYQDMAETDASYGVLMLANKHNFLGDYEPEDLEELGDCGSWGSMAKEARDAFAALTDAAAEDGMRIWGVSPYRSFERQRAIYNRYVAKNGQRAADTYSARPGSSEHQTGLAVDVAVRGRSYNTFGGTKEDGWMREHAHEFGFILRYDRGMDYITGYMYEPWHYRYVGVDAATYIWEHELTFEEYYYYYVVGGESPEAAETEEAADTPDEAQTEPAAQPAEPTLASYFRDYWGKLP